MFLVGTSEGKRSLGKSRKKAKIKIKWVFKQQGVTV
jgi:hypothetical protein